MYETTSKKTQETIELQEFRGANYRKVLYEYTDGDFYKQLIALTVFSARDYAPHSIVSVNVNGLETLFGQDTKKAMEFYNNIKKKC
ncbi:MAG: hypothetical protein J6X18_01055 [Bacteroidales bacterium]|nr:hypothetical protein [Bacteroidales bacterium]